MFRDHPVACTVSLLVSWIFCDHPFWYHCFNVSQTYSEEPRRQRVAAEFCCGTFPALAQITRSSLELGLRMIAVVLNGARLPCDRFVLSVSVGECIKSELYLHLRFFFFTFSLLVFCLTFKMYSDAHAGILGGF